MTISGSLDFGTIAVGTTSAGNFTVGNSGKAALTVTGMRGPSGYTSSWTSGTIPPGGSQRIDIRFAPTEARRYDGTITLDSNSSGGTTTIAVRGGADRPAFFFSGTGDTVFDMPTGTNLRVKITGDYSGFSSNFIVHIAGNHVVNELIGTTWPNGTHFEGTYLTNGGTVQILSSSGVRWSFTELR